MICPICGGEGFLKLKPLGGGLALVPCPECNGSGVASCCDAAGSADLSAHCAACGASQPFSRMRCDQCGAPLVFADLAMRANLAYRDDAFPERECNNCGKPYRGPAVYCSLECAVADA